MWNVQLRLRLRLSIRRRLGLQNNEEIHGQLRFCWTLSSSVNKLLQSQIQVKANETNLG